MAKTRDQMVTIVADAVGKARAAISISGALLSDRCVDFLNWGQERIARAYSFDELNILKEDSATVTSVKTYPLTTGTNNLGLTRPKDIESIRLIDSENSRNLRRWGLRKFDARFPYPENYSTGRSSIYVQHGGKLELFRIPDAAYTLYIRYPRWPAELSATSSTTEYEYKDQLLITAAILEGYLHFEEYNDVVVWTQLFLGRLSDAIKAEGDMDWEPQAAEFSIGRGGYSSGEPWLDPYGTPNDPLSGYSE
jgi:hypothetical protein